MSLSPPVQKEKKSSFCLARGCQGNPRGAILIVTLWVLAILTVLAVALGQRASLAVKLVQYQRDQLKSSQLARAAIERAICEKRNDVNLAIDTLNESWANNAAAFKDFVLGEGTFTVSYSFAGTTLYGLEDETSKININYASGSMLQSLMDSYENGVEAALAIYAWRSEGLEPEEESYYQGLDLPYHCKNAEVKSIAELLLVREVTPRMLYGEDQDGDGRISAQEQGLAQYLTVYTDGKVNINTACAEVLRALIAGSFPDWDTDEVAFLVEKITDYRRGLDEIIGTDDDYYFSIEKSNLVADQAFFTIYGVSSLEWQRLQSLQTMDRLSVASRTYTIYAAAEVKKVREGVAVTIELNDQERKYLAWHRY